jgi:hypothetical protein
MDEHDTATGYAKRAVKKWNVTKGYKLRKTATAFTLERVAEREMELYSYYITVNRATPQAQLRLTAGCETTDLIQPTWMSATVTVCWCPLFVTLRCQHKSRLLLQYTE